MTSRYVFKLLFLITNCTTFAGHATDLSNHIQSYINIAPSTSITVTFRTLRTTTGISLGSRHNICFLSSAPSDAIKKATPKSLEHKKDYLYFFFNIYSKVIYYLKSVKLVFRTVIQSDRLMM
jgi:hypothetical protein